MTQPPPSLESECAILSGEEIGRILFPHMAERARELLTGSRRFVYYTTAEIAAQILTNREVWMRSPMTMNDFMEVEHGRDCLIAAYRGESGVILELERAIDECFPGLAAEIRSAFDRWLPYLEADTYVTCVSEHLRGEDEHGRLSMWRAYGGETGVALVLNSRVFLRESHALRVYSSPVAYLDQDGFTAALRSIAEKIAAKAAYVRTVGREDLKNRVFEMLRLAVLCTKHPGFNEEKEWRVVASPTLHSSPLPSSIQCVRGVPQAVLKIPLEDDPEKDLIGLAIPSLLDHVIVGPCEFPLVVRNAFIQLLEAAEVPTPHSKVYVSGIPLRHNER